MIQFFSSKLFSILVISVVIGAIGYGMFLVGSPITQRTLLFDKKRAADLHQISFVIDEYWSRNTDLPGTLEDLQDSRYYFVESIVDPATAIAYEYRVIEGKQYELCATFETDSLDTKALPKVSRMQGTSFFDQHNGEHTCFSLEVEPRITPQVR
tara:strand:+ start:491 stop:952 length:462 start_codon:yes stop_codon:yes gene_type:complete